MVISLSSYGQQWWRRNRAEKHAIFWRRRSAAVFPVLCFSQWADDEFLIASAFLDGVFLYVSSNQPTEMQNHIGCNFLAMHWFSHWSNRIKCLLAPSQALYQWWWPYILQSTEDESWSFLKWSFFGVEPFNPSLRNLTAKLDCVQLYIHEKCLPMLWK